ncbi:hypothetical protein P689_122252 [Candidatus Riesia pediculischaeffi PTSU]|uniref:Uncharacterized protein n=1 Tax=Candidatus Riesia pediculischaeffi PTSU TaxID=1401651 RepID=A0A0C1VIZ1_9ENTR|nr:hypothetical protein P689_122252 [Candidatus Riesia pediculischaeffi PTSU]
MNSYAYFKNPTTRLRSLKSMILLRIRKSFISFINESSL